MKSQLNLKKAIITALFVIIGTAVFAQTGKISGKVSDKKTGETMIGVTVKIAGTTKGASTDVEGRYVIAGLSSGKYILTFQYVGYTTKEVADVEVTSGAATSFDVVLDEANGQNLSEITIQGTFRKESINALYAQQKNSISISSGVSADLIKKSPDRNTSDVLKRVSGASIQDNKFVVIRGLSDRYNSAMLNNAILPSTEPDRKAFSFDIFPSNLIDRIIINKTATPDLPGDFAGGIIQIFTKDVPDENFIELSVSEGYNTQSTFKNAVSNERGSNDWLGFASKNRFIPDNVPGTASSFNSLEGQEKTKVNRLFNNSYPEVNKNAPLTQNHQLTIGLRKDLKNSGKFGSILSLTYRNSVNLVPDVLRNDWDNPETRTVFVKQFNDSQTKYNTTLGGLANFSYSKDNNKISWKNSYNRVFDELYYVRNGVNRNNLVNINFRSNDLVQKTFYNTQLEGDHKLNEKDWKLNWNLNYANIIREQPDLRTIEYTQPIDNPSAPFLMIDRNSRRFYSELNENNYGAALNFSLPFKMFDQKSTLKLGGLGLYKDRTFKARVFQYRSNFSDVAKENAARALTFDKIFEQNNIQTTDGFTLMDITNNNDKYDGNSMLGAGYVMLDNKLNEKFRLVWGARLEYYHQNIDALDVSGLAIDAKESYLDILPSINLTYALSERSNVRLSGSKTVSRPEFRELAPFTFYDFQTNTSVRGNADLKRSANYNGDLRYEFYPSAGEALTISGFYKKFQNPIELMVNPSTNADTRLVEYANAKNATTYGVELEVRKKLNFIPGSWGENLTFFANAAYINSKVDLGINGGSLSRPLQGQSPYLINSGLQYFAPNSGFTVNALFNRIGHRINIVGFNGYPDLYENARNVLDFQISKKVLKKNGEIKINVSDILNNKIMVYQNLDDKKSYDEAIDRNFYQYKPGSTISLSFAYKFGLK